MLGDYNYVVYALAIWPKLLLYMPSPTTSQTLSISFLSCFIIKKKNYNLPYVHGNTQLTINVLLTYYVILLLEPTCRDLAIILI